MRIRSLGVVVESAAAFRPRCRWSAPSARMRMAWMSSLAYRPASAPCTVQLKRRVVVRDSLSDPSRRRRSRSRCPGERRRWDSSRACRGSTCRPGRTASLRAGAATACRRWPAAAGVAARRRRRCACRAPGPAAIARCSSGSFLMSSICPGSSIGLPALMR